MGGAIPIAILFFLAAGAGSALAFRISREESIAARELLGLAIAVVEWSFFYGLEVLANSEFFRLLWSQFAYLGTYATSVFLLRFAVRWLRPRRQGWWLQLFWVVPVFMVIGVFTNQLHGLVWPAIYPSEIAPYVWFYEHGPIFWFGILYQYLTVAVSVFLLIAATVTHRGIYRRQSVYILAGVAIAVAGNAIYVSRLINLPIDITPLSLGVSSLIAYAGISRGRLLELLPAARHHVVDLMPDGLLVLDREFRVMDWNQAALRMWHVTQADPTGVPVAHLVPHWTDEVADRLRESDVGVFHTTLSVEDQPGTISHVEVEVRPFALGSRSSEGWIVTFRDESVVRRTERDLQEANERLESLNKMLLTQAIHDALTGLFNRAYLDEALPRELARCSRDGSTIALLILDVDHFKEINDGHGHDVGDRVLKEVAKLVRGIVRAGDIPCRFGGDEIVAVMPGATEPEAASVAERIRSRVSEEEIVVSEEKLAVTVSVGVAVYPVHASSAAELFRAADRALYAAKDAGRNRALSAANTA